MRFVFAIARMAAAPLVAIVLAVLPVQGAGASGPDLPDTYTVSREPGALPEGIAIGRNGTMYVTSDATGGLYRGHVKHDELRPFAADGTTERGNSRGIHTDAAGRIFSVGADTLTAHSRGGRLLASQVAPAGPLGPPSLNDVAIAKDAVYVTDWANPIVYRASLKAGKVGPLRPLVDLREALPDFPAQFWLLNGIVLSDDGRTLLVASNGTEAVWRIDVVSGDVSQVDLGGQSFGADGMVLHGSTLYAVLNYGAPHGIYVVQLDRDLRSGHVTDTILSDANGAPFDLPTTLARHHCRLYVVNGQLDDPPGEPPYTVSALDDPSCGRS